MARRPGRLKAGNGYSAAHPGENGVESGGGGAVMQKWRNEERARGETECEWYWLAFLPDGEGVLLTEFDLRRGRKRWEREGEPRGKFPRWWSGLLRLIGGGVVEAGL